MSAEAAAKKLAAKDAPEFKAVRPMPLYEITEEVVELLTELELNEGELNDEDFEKLEALELAFDKKVTNICAFVRELEARSKVFAEEAKRLADRGRTLKNKGTRLKTYVLDSMNARGVKKIEGDLVGARVQKSAPSVEITDLEAIPGDYMIQPPPEPRKTLLKDALKAGEAIPGAELTQHTHLRIF